MSELRIVVKATEDFDAVASAVTKSRRMLGGHGHSIYTSGDEILAFVFGVPLLFNLTVAVAGKETTARALFGTAFNTTAVVSMEVYA